jgi:membrane-anchored protein YejM (alkaline phosphatase superfamily)
MSLHQDVVPTLMQSALGCSSEIADYSNGQHLFKLPASRGTVIASYMGGAYLFDGKVLERTAGRRYGWNDMKQSVDRPTSQTMQSLREEEARFLGR